MRASLISREVIADSVELVMHAERLDASVTIAGCDKSLPGMAMAAARLNLSFGVPVRRHDHARPLAGPRRHDPGRLRGRRHHGSRPDDGGGAARPGAHACPGAGSCAGMYTANTMACAAEALGLSLPGTATPPRIDPRRTEAARASRGSRREAARSRHPPRDILTFEAFENAIAVVMALGGSTNAVLHLLAIAREAEVPLSLDDFDRISRKVPHLVDVRPGGRFVMSDLDKVGGVPTIVRELDGLGLIHTDALTASTETWAEALSRIDPPAPDGEVIRAATEPLHPWGGLVILRGSLAPEGAVVKAGHMEGRVFRAGPGCSTPSRTPSRSSPTAASSPATSW